MLATRRFPVGCVLLNGTGAQISSQTVGADGAYQFLGLQPGTYTVKLTTLPPGFALSGAKIARAQLRQKLGRPAGHPGT